MAANWLCVSICILLVNPVVGVVNQPFTDALAELQKEGVTKAQILKWWEVTVVKRKRPRVFSICIRKLNQAYPPGLANWGPILDHIALSDIRLFEDIKHIYFKPLSFIENWTVNTVLQTDKTDGWPAGKLNKLNQWIHLHIKFKSSFKAKGVLIQAITGPLGLPGGLFDTSLFCTNTDPLRNMQKEPNWDKVTFTHPCTISPRSASVWPNVFVFDGTRISSSFTATEVSLRFRFTEAQCMETGFFQFIYIITKSFKPNDYEVRVSNMYELRNQDKETGIATGAYLGFTGDEGYHCNQALPVREPQELLIPNAEHDYCVTKEGWDKHYTCPPGPFECGNLWSTAEDLNKRISRWGLFNSVGNHNFGTSRCCEIGEIRETGPTTTSTTSTSTTTTTPAPPGPVPPQPPTPPSSSSTSSSTSIAPPSNITTSTTLPPTRLTTTLKPEQQVEKQLGNRATEAERASQVTHGDVCVLVWLVLIPIADHIGRYYKDFPDFKKVGLGFWIIAHVSLHVVGLVLIWYSFGLVVGTGDNKLGNVSAAHLCLGAITTILQHIGYFTALHQFDDISVSEAFKFVASHALGGKAAFLFAFFSIVLSNGDLYKRLACVGLVIFRGITIGVTIYVEFKQDAHIGLYVHRARCPVLQRIVMEGGARPPLMKTKTLVLSVMVIVLLSGFICILIFFEK